ncbi:MAG: hypothetical protein Q8R02_21290 [Hyphomonadaceae bacterium]|nr:hypothetical protein [Hyphomonadaceae bacterium]
MIDRHGRDRLALALRRYVIGRITNDDLEEVEVDWRDRGAVAVKRRSWHLYSDHRCYYRKGKDALPWEVRREVARWIVFLGSNQEYVWPEYRLDVGPWFGRKRKTEQFMEAGDFAVWPFIDAAALQTALRAPRFFAHRAIQPDLALAAEKRSDNS